MDNCRIRFSFYEAPDKVPVTIYLGPSDKLKLHSYGLEHRVSLDNQVAVISPYSGGYTEEAIRFFYAVRDAIVLAQSGRKVKSDCELMKQQLKEEFGVKNADGSLKSTKDYTRRELWELCRGAVDWLGEAGGVLEDNITYRMLQEGKDE